MIKRTPIKLSKELEALGQCWTILRYLQWDCKLFIEDDHLHLMDAKKYDHLLR